MKYVDEYRDPVRCRQLLDEIRRTATTERCLMEVCGGQTHGLLRYGIDDELAGVVRLIHGPGCPVCVTGLEAIDFAVELSRDPGVLLTSFGDMLRVPGSRCSLLTSQTEHGNVRTVYSPLDAVDLAERHPERQVVFFAVGFETTAPATALAVRRARARNVKNFSMIVSHVCVLPAMEMLAADPANRVEGFLAAGHVCTITGFAHYREFAEKFRTPVVVTGFEPVDLLAGILDCVQQLEQGEATVSNRYGRSVRTEGNASALELMSQVYEVCDRPWRGIGTIERGGLRLKSEFAEFDATRRFEHCLKPADEPTECRSGDVLVGRIKPTECECFGTRCTPETPLGAPMVSAEGACAAYFQYGHHSTVS